MYIHIPDEMLQALFVTAQDGASKQASCDFPPTLLIRYVCSVSCEFERKNPLKCLHWRESSEGMRLATETSAVYGLWTSVRPPPFILYFVAKASMIYLQRYQELNLDAERYITDGCGMS